MGLPRLIPCVLGPKRIDDYKVKEVMSRFSSQKLFAGYDFDEARDIINRYYEDHDTSLAKDVKAIRDAYIHINLVFPAVHFLRYHLTHHGVFQRVINDFTL